MKVMHADYEILTPISDGGIKELQQIERIGRVCYKSEDKITEDGESAKNFVEMLLIKGHEAMLEHSTLSVKFYVDRGISHEVVRHRIASFAQESTRYCNYSSDKFGNECSFITPADAFSYDRKVEGLPLSVQENIVEEWVKAMEDAESHYLKMLGLGASPQIARSVLPTSTKTELVVTANYREWRNFFRLRTARTAHPQMRQITLPLLYELKKLIPVVFDDIDVVE